MLTDIDEINLHILCFAEETLLAKLLEIDKNKVLRIISSFIDILFDNYFEDYNNLIDLMIKLVDLKEMELVNSFMKKIYQKECDDFNIISILLIEKDLRLAKLFFLTAPIDFNWNETGFSICRDSDIYDKNLLLAIIETKYLAIVNSGDIKFHINYIYRYNEKLRPLAGICKIMISCQKLQKLLTDAQKQLPKIDSIGIINNMLIFKEL